MCLEHVFGPLHYSMQICSYMKLMYDNVINSNRCNQTEQQGPTLIQAQSVKPEVPSKFHYHPGKGN